MQGYSNEDILDNLINLQIDSNIINNEERFNNNFNDNYLINFNEEILYNNNYLDNFNEVIKKNKNVKVLINDMEITEDSLNKLNDSYAELTNCPDLHDNDYMILSDIMQAINFVYKKAQIEFDCDVDGIIYTSSISYFQLRGSYSELKSEEKLINNRSIARNFVENQINDGNLLRIIQKTQSSIDKSIRNAGRVLDLILINNNRSSLVQSNKIINMPKLSI